jgi:hypothetical protein
VTLLAGLCELWARRGDARAYRFGAVADRTVDVSVVFDRVPFEDIAEEVLLAGP